MKTLLVINEPLLLDAMALMLGPQGHQVIAAPTLEEALRALSVDEIDLLVAGLNLAPSGAEPLVQAAREKDPHLPVLLVAGSFGRDAEKRILNMSAVFWQTGEGMASLASAVQRALLH